MSGNGASRGGNGCDTFLLEANRLDSLRLSAMFTICAESTSSGPVRLDRLDVDASGDAGSAKESRFVRVVPLVTSEDRLLPDGSGVEVLFPFPFACPPSRRIFSGVDVVEVAF